MSTDGSPEALNVIATTRSIRRYADEQIPVTDLNAIIWHATRAPSGSNRQPFRFLVLRDGPMAMQAKKLLGDSFRQGWASKSETDGYRTEVEKKSDSRKARQAATMQHYVDNIEKVPVIVLACLVRYRGPSPYEGASIYPACQNLLLAARALGYGGALTMWHQTVDAELRLLLSIPDEVALSACITLGRPLGSHGAVRRRPIAELVFEDSWGSAPQWASDPEGTSYTSAGPKK